MDHGGVIKFGQQLRALSTNDASGLLELAAALNCTGFVLLGSPAVGVLGFGASCSGSLLSACESVQDVLQPTDPQIPPRLGAGRCDKSSSVPFETGLLSLVFVRMTFVQS